MKKRDLYAEIAEGFDALSCLRDGKATSCNGPAHIVGRTKAPNIARESEGSNDDLDASADDEIIGSL